MNEMKTFVKRILAAALLALLLLASFSFFSYAEEFENDPGITLTVSASKATNGPNTLSGSGTLVSSSETNIFNFFAKDAAGRKLFLEYEIGGVKTTLQDKYFSYACGGESDYGEMTVRVYEKDGALLAVFSVALRFESGGSRLQNKWKEFKRDLYLNFVEGDNWRLLLKGLGNTLIITVFALVIGIAIGTVVAAVRSTYDKNKEMYALRGGPVRTVMSALNSVCSLYLTVIRGTPVVVQLLIMYFIIFAGAGQDLVVAIIAFGVNSGAYVAEILRGGIMSVDEGQFEAGRSLGFSYLQTMRYIIIPQMFKSSLPALANEFISLLKETSVAGYVPIIELTKAGNIIRSSTYTAFLPLLAVALIYLTLVVGLSKLVKLLERRLRKSER